MSGLKNLHGAPSYRELLFRIEALGDRLTEYQKAEAEAKRLLAETNKVHFEHLNGATARADEVAKTVVDLKSYRVEYQALKDRVTANEQARAVDADRRGRERTYSLLMVGISMLVALISLAVTLIEHAR